MKVIRLANGPADLGFRLLQLLKGKWITKGNNSGKELVSGGYC